MKMIKETQEETVQDQSLSKDLSKNSEPLQKPPNDIQNQISQLTSEQGKVSVSSESTKSQINQKLSVNKENIIKKEEINKINEEEESESKQGSLKNNLALSIKNDVNVNNSHIKTPLMQDSQNINYKQKTKLNFQEKSSVGASTGNDFKSHRNSISMRSPIYSYFDESQRYLSEQYSEENLFNLTGQKKNNKTSSNKEIPKKINNTSLNSDGKPFFQPKSKRSNSSINRDNKEEHEIETPNYNDFNLFTDSSKSPDYFNMNQANNNMNNIFGNKFSRKLSQATGSCKEDNSTNKFGNYGTLDNENNDLNMNLPLNDMNEDIFNNFSNLQNNNINNNMTNEDISNQIQFLNNRQIMNNNDNILLGNLSNPGLNIDNNNNNINKRNLLLYNDYINSLGKQISNNELNNLNNLNNGMNINNEYLNGINQLKNLNLINNNLNNNFGNVSLEM